jgi:hypothetical protein
LQHYWENDMPRIVTICINDVTARWSDDPVETTNSRLQWASILMSHINARWEAIDAVLLPGGFLYLDDYIGHLPDNERIERLNAAFGGIATATGRLTHSPGALVVAGVDGQEVIEDEDGDIWGDQLCVAWNGGGVTGIGRKIFPTRGEEAVGLVVYEEDFSTPNRLVTLPSGVNAVLCACYDGYAVGRRQNHDAAWQNSIRYISNTGNPANEYHEANAEEVTAGCDSFDHLLHGCQVALISIHGFQGNNPVGRWQHYGLRPASSALEGFAYAAAHFINRLPSTADVCILTAANGHDLEPADWFEISSDHGLALVRLFN